MVGIGLVLLGISRFAGDPRFEALGFVVGAPVLAVGALTLAYTRIGPHIPNLRRWREERRE
jgi:hypothetical protein